MLRLLMMAGRRRAIAAGRFQARRQFTTGTSFVPRITLFRLFWTGTTATIGYVSYKVNEAHEWFNERVGEGLLLGLEGVMKVMDVWASIGDTFDDWNWLSTSKPNESVTAAPAAPPSSSSTSNSEKRPKEFQDFIKRMIEIKGILQGAGIEASSVRLPQIVVIGSQSSGKSSVLEAIVGHEFLPKGTNMVTRRPLELTLVNSPGLGKDYAVLPQVDPNAQFQDWRQIQTILTDLNLAVPDSQWVSSKPIQLIIHSPNVPDLNLIDLPGYIQVTSRGQPAQLRDQIVSLCEEYIQQPNLILAICPADVDLANAEALQACRRVDPKGERTIGVITKLDLVEPSWAAHLLRNEDYPLPMGYVGVVCKPTEDGRTKRSLTSDYEGERLSHAAFGGLEDQLGIPSLRTRLTEILEQRMAASVVGILERVQEELAEVRYALKVEYNDRLMSADAYVSQVTSGVKAGFERVAARWSRPVVRERVAAILHDRMLQVPESAPLAAQVAAFTRSGVGRATCNGLVESILADLRQAIIESPLTSHQAARDRLMSQVEGGLRAQCRTAIEQVENSLKPFKAVTSVEQFDAAEWQSAFDQVSALIEDRISSLDRQCNEIQARMGKSKLRRAVQLLQQERKGEAIDLSSGLRDAAEEAVRLHYSMSRLQARLQHLQSNQCHAMTFSSWLPSFLSSSPALSDRLASCPEVYLHLVCQRLIEVSSLYVHFELIHEFLTPLPDTLESGLLPADRLTFIRENPQIARHLQLLERRSALERVRERLLYLRQYHKESS